MFYGILLVLGVVWRNASIDDACCQSKPLQMVTKPASDSEYASALKYIDSGADARVATEDLSDEMTRMDFDQSIMGIPSLDEAMIAVLQWLSVVESSDFPTTSTAKIS